MRAFQACFLFVEEEHPQAGIAAGFLVLANTIEANGNGRAIVIGTSRSGHPVKMGAYADFACWPAQIDQQVGATGLVLLKVAGTQRVEVLDK